MSSSVSQTAHWPSLCQQVVWVIAAARNARADSRWGCCRPSVHQQVCFWVLQSQGLYCDFWCNVERAQPSLQGLVGCLQCIGFVRKMVRVKRR
jgi:hypothetical protein